MGRDHPPRHVEAPREGQAQVTLDDTKTHGAPLGDVSLGDVSLGDVIRAWRLLGAATEDERRAIAKTLRFDLRAPTPTPVQPRTPTTIAPEPDRPAATTAAPTAPPVAEEPQPIDLVPFTDVQVNP